MEEERNLKLVANNNLITATNPFSKTSKDDINLDILANKVASMVNTQAINEELKKQYDKIDKLNNGIANLVNELKKQSVDENNSSFKLARANENANFTIDSLSTHITHIISCTHIAECYHLMTNTKIQKPSVNKARKLLIDLNLIDDINFVSKSLNGTKTITKKYHHSILQEIKKRLMNPTAYNISLAVSENWRRTAFIPDDTEINNKLTEIFNLLK